MRSLLGVLMVLAVSADEDLTIEGVAGESVVLPCSSTGINKFKRFHWQLESDRDPVLIINQNMTGDGYVGRAELFVNDTDNCALTLHNITDNDTGKYRCSFGNQEAYEPFFVNLNVSDVRNLKVSGSSDRSSQGPPKDRIRFLKIIPIVFLLGFCLVLWFRRERVSH